MQNSEGWTIPMIEACLASDQEYRKRIIRDIRDLRGNIAFVGRAFEESDSDMAQLLDNLNAVTEGIRQLRAIGAQLGYAC